jgi:hypothetical protein
MKIKHLNLTAAWLLMPLLLFPALTRAQTAAEAWVQRYDGPAPSDDYAQAVAVDGSNNVIVAGTSSVGVFPSLVNNYVTIKYSSAGVPLWTNLYFTGSAYAAAVDGNGDVIVAGDPVAIKYSSGGSPLWTNYCSAVAVAVDGSNNVIVAGNAFRSGSGMDYATIKYSSAGAPLWTNYYNGPVNSSDQVKAVAVDNQNNVIVTGYSQASASYPYNADFVTIQYSSDGVSAWTNRYNGPGNNDDKPSALAMDRNNNVIVTGYSYSSSNRDSSDFLTIQYSSTGVPLWTNRYNGPANADDEAFALAVDGSNNVIVTGYSVGAESSFDYLTIQYSSMGVPLWTNRYNGPANYWDQASALGVDGSNNVVATGYSYGSGGNSDYLTIQYSSAGEPLWTNRYNGPANGGDSVKALAVDHTGAVIVTGASGGDFATVKYELSRPAPPVITDYFLTNGTFQMRVEGLSESGLLVIEASTNLVGWSPLFTNTTPTNVVFYTDPDANNYLWRFYRGRVQ